MATLSRIVCAIDFSDQSRQALVQAAAFAGQRRGALTLLHVVVNRPVPESPPEALTDPERARLTQRLREVAASIPELAADTLVLEATTVDSGILAAIADLDADLLVMGTHGRSGFRHLFLGSITEKVIRRAPCPTLVVPPAGAAAHTPAIRRQIICPVDFSPSSLSALAQALHVAQESGARLLLLHAVEVPPPIPEMPSTVDLATMIGPLQADARRRLYDLVPVDARAYCSVEVAVVEGRAHREILRHAAERQADLIVMGVHGRGAVDLLLFGSTTHQVLRAAPCPVLVVHSEEGAAVWRAAGETREQALATRRRP